MLTAIEHEKFNRHFLIDGFTIEHQIKLKNAKVLIIGAGGLGSPVLMYLSGAGIGLVGIAENDRLSSSNMHRQILYSAKDLGKSKIKLASLRINEFEPQCKIELHEEWWNSESANKIAPGYDILVDCTDNYESRYLTDDISRKYSIPFVYGAVHHFEGQVSVFNFNGGRSYSNLFPKKKHADKKPLPTGVLGPLPGIVGSMQAAEVIKIITGLGEVLANKLLVFSLKHNRYQVIGF